MSNKHKVLLLTILATFLFVVFGYSPKTQAAICLNQVTVPTGMTDFTQVLNYCAKNNSTPVFYERGNGLKCVDGTEFPTGVRVQGTEEQTCAGHGGFDPAGEQRCDDGFDLTSLNQADAAAGLGKANQDATNTWCASHSHVGYHFEAEDLTTPTASGSTSGNAAASCNGSQNDAALKACVAGNPIIGYLKEFINFLSAGVLVVVIAMIIIGGIQYSASGGDPNGVADAKKKILNALLALLAYIFMYAFIQWLLPGGLF